MKVLLIFWPGNDSGFLKKVIVKVSMFDFMLLFWNWDREILSESWRVVVPDSSTVAESLEDGVTYLYCSLNFLLLNAWTGCLFKGF